MWIAFWLGGTRHARREYNTGVMRIFGFRDFARSAPLVAVAVLLCIGVFLPSLGNESEAPGSLKGAHYSQADQGSNGGGHPPTGSHLTAIGEEAKDGDKGPVNAGLLTELIFVFFGAIFGWLLSNNPGTFRSSSITYPPSFVIACEDVPFLGVFRL